MTYDPRITWQQRPVALPQHPLVRRAMVLGILSVLGILCLLPAVMGPFAWYFGSVARREIEREPTRWSGRTEATVAMICGIVGTGLLALALLVGALVVGGNALLLNPPSGY